MNTRCASTLFVVAMSVIAVVYGAPADATVGVSNEDDGLGCYCTLTKAQATGNTYEECAKPDQWAVCMTALYDTKELGYFIYREGLPAGLEGECGKEFGNMTVPDPFDQGSTLFVIDGKIDCCYTTDCNK